MRAVARVCHDLALRLNDCELAGWPVGCGSGMRDVMCGGRASNCANAPASGGGGAVSGANCGQAAKCVFVSVWS